VQIDRVELDRAKLAAMPEAERVVLLLLAHGSNEVNVLTKLILMTGKDDPSSPTVDHVEAGQMFILMRLLIGKLHEAWELFKLRVQSDIAIKAKYIPRLDPDGANALQALNRHFGQGSALTAIRNKIAFHYTDKQNLTETNFKQLALNEPLMFYLGDTIGHTFFHAAELVVQLGVINLMKVPAVDPSDSRPVETRAFGVLCQEIVEVSRDITQLFGSLINMLAEGLGSALSTEKIPDGPKMSTFSLPFFFDENDIASMRSKANAQL
jgi:hypothetical protein